MQPTPQATGNIRFGLFEADLAAGELRKRGRRIALQEKPFQLLALLLRRAGEIVTREELQNELWPGESFGEFDQGVNTAVKKIRQALGDSAENPRFIETLPRKGYRFIAPVAHGEPAIEVSSSVRRSLRLAAGMGSAAAVAAAMFWFFADQSTQEPSLTIVPLTTYPGQELEPSFSPDGNHVAFSWNGETGANFDIYVKQIGTEPAVRLTTDAAKDFGPAWSPDGRSIAFGRILGPLKAGIYVVPSIGGPERKLTETLPPHTRRPNPFLAWSPDGQWLVISEPTDTAHLLLKPSVPTDGSPPAGLFLLSVQTGERSRLTDPPPGSMFDAGPAFSPDGRTLAFVRASSLSVTDLYLLNLTADLRPLGQPTRLTSWNQATTSPSWTPDGREILVASGRWDASSLWRVAVSGTSPPRRLEFGGGNADFPVIRGPGRLVYAQRSIDTNIWRAHVSGASAGAKAPTRFIASTRLDLFPQFSPDGTRILFLSDRSGSTEVWVANADGSRPMQLTFMNAPIVGAPRWAPDGEQIIFDSNRGGRWELYVISAAGGEPRALTDHPADECCGSWSHDGQWIYFMSSRSGQRQIWKMRAGTGKAVQITRGDGHVALESPDGRFLYYSTRGGEGERNGMTGLRRVPVNGGTEEEVLPSVTFYNFAVTHDGIFFTPRADAEGRSAIHFFSFASRKSHPVAAVTTIVPGISVSPDGRWLLYSQIDERRSDLMLVENFR